MSRIKNRQTYILIFIYFFIIAFANKTLRTLFPVHINDYKALAGYKHLCTCRRANTCKDIKKKKKKENKRTNTHANGTSLQTDAIINQQ